MSCRISFGFVALAFGLTSLFAASTALAKTLVGLSCNSDSDCVIVQTGWCKSVVVTTNAQLEHWRVQDAKATAEARARAQECKPGSEQDPAKYRARCRTKVCVLDQRHN